MNIPIVFAWDGEVMKPLGRFAQLADKEFVIGENYQLEVTQPRSMASHRHYFACIAEAWANLPEDQAGRWPTPEHLRKWALVQAGYREETTYVAASKAEALRFAAFMRSVDGFAVVVVNDRTVMRMVARSQSLSAMTRADFSASKDAVLSAIGRLIGVDPTELRRNTGKAA